MKLKNHFVSANRYLLTRRTWLGGSYLEYLVVFLFFTALTITYTGFVAFHIITQLFAGVGDATAGFLWLNFVDPGLDPILHATNYVNYPYGEVLGGPTFITYAALWLPLRVLSFLFGPVAGLNLVMFWGYISAAFAMYWLVKRLTHRISIGLFAGFATAFVPYAIYQSSGHLAYIFSYVFILIIAGFIAIMRRPTKLRAALLAIAIALAFYTDGYYVLIASVLAAALGVAGALYCVVVRMSRGEIWKRLKAVFLTIGCLAVLVVPIGYVQLSQGNQITKTLGSARSNIGNEIREYRSKIVDFIIPPASNPFLGKNSDFQKIHKVRDQHSNPMESTTYIGFVLIILSVMSGVILVVWFLRNRSQVKTIHSSQWQHLILIGCITICTIPILLSFMFSPEIHILGHRIPLPGALLSHYNIGLWRVMTRFFIPLHIVIVLFASIGLWIVLEKLTIKQTHLWKNRLIRGGVVVILGLILAFEYATTIYQPPYDFTKVQSGYLWLKGQTDIKVVAELPIVDPLDYHTADYTTAQIVHGKKIVNFKDPNDMRLTDTLGGVANPETIDWVYQRGAQAVITHNHRCVNESWGILAYKDDSNLKTAMCIYRINKPLTPDTAFIRYGNGFAYSPNQPDPSVTVFNAGTATLYVTGNDFVIPDIPGKAYISADLTGPSGDAGQGRWHIIQNGKEINSGELQSSKTKISALVDRRFAVEIRIDRADNRKIGLGEYTLQDAQASNVTE